MGSSYVAFQGKGYWARDDMIEDWLAYLVQAIDELREIPDWLRQPREYWKTLSVERRGSGISFPLLDEYVHTPEQIGLLLTLTARALAMVRHETADLEAVETVGLCFLQLLRGEFNQVKVYVYGDRAMFNLIDVLTTAIPDGELASNWTDPNGKSLLITSWVSTGNQRAWVDCDGMNVHCTGFPDLMASRDPDAAQYLGYGIREYWYIDRLGKTLSVYTLENGTVQTLGTFGVNETFVSPVLSGQKIEIGAIFKR
jgi:hypothetical protein